MSRVVAIIQARLGSTRLPRKALMDVGGMRMIDRVVAQVSKMAGLDEIAVACPFADMEPLRQPVVKICGWLGAEADVLGRYAWAAIQTSADIVVRITADCPLWDPHQGERVLALYRDTHVHYASNIAPGYRDGEDVEVFSRAALQDADTRCVDTADREHVTVWMRKHCYSATLQPTEIRSDVKTSVDTEEDLARVCAMVAG